MSIRIVETITGDTTAELRLGRETAELRADVVEVRVDGVADLDLPAVLAERRAPVIVTCRPVWEGGRYDGAEPDRLRLLRRARALGAEFIDVEFRADWRSVAAFEGVESTATRTSASEGLVLSLHDFAGIPADLDLIAAAMSASGADVVKIAVTPTHLMDCEALRRAGRLLRSGVIIGMGPAGAVTRVAPQLFNSCWTYCGALASLGQIPAREMREVYGVGRVSAAASLFGVTGRPVMHSKSPALHNAAFRHEGIDAVYVPLEAHDFDDFNAFARMFDVQGASVTAPFKADAFAAAATVDAAAKDTRAANTLTRGPGGWLAANTDAAGFLAPLGDLVLRRMKTAVIGQGGAARSVRHALESAGAQVTLLGRDDLDRASEVWDLLVNATPVGTAPHAAASVMSGRRIRARVVYDLVYNPADTRLLQDARAAGARAIGGMPMLVAQACRQFECWFGRPAPVDVYEQAAKALTTYETDDIRRVR